MINKVENMKNSRRCKWWKRRSYERLIINRSLRISVQSMTKRMSGFSRILFNLRLKSILMILIRKSCMINNICKRKYLLKIQKVKRKGLKKEIFIKMLNIRFIKNKNRNVSNKCRNYRRMKELKKLLMKKTKKLKMKGVMKNLKRFLIDKNQIIRSNK